MQFNLLLSTNTAGIRCWQRSGFQVVGALPGAFRHRRLGYVDALVMVQSLEAWMAEQQEQAGCVISAVGSLTLAQLRLAVATQATAIQGELEILSLSGTLSPDGAHLHIAVADRKGAVIGLLPEWQFRRELDPATGYAELQIRARDPG